MKSEDVIKLISDERKRQIEKEGWTFDHDDEHEDAELAMAAALYASPDDNLMIVNHCDCCKTVKKIDDPWPWWDSYNYDRYNDGGVNIEDHAWDKRKSHDRIKRLVIAGALIVAEIERLKRLEKTEAAK